MIINVSLFLKVLELIHYFYYAMPIALTNWLYKRSPIVELPEDCVGFVYLITNITNNRKYIGKKLAKSTKTNYRTQTLADGTKKKRATKTSQASDWQNYWGSSRSLQADIDLLGQQYFRREILHLCTSRSECSYLEVKEQIDRRVLESDEYYNNFIGVKVNGNNIAHK